MDERKYVDWDYSMPGISFCLKSGRVTIFKTTLEVIGYPEFYRFLYNPDTKILAIEPCAMNALGAYALVNVKKEETYDVSSISFVRMMYRENDWDKLDGNLTACIRDLDFAVQVHLRPPLLSVNFLWKLRSILQDRKISTVF